MVEELGRDGGNVLSVASEYTAFTETGGVDGSYGDILLDIGRQVQVLRTLAGECG